jgi:hypothetical protein
MREWGKTITMDLIRWVLLLFDSLIMRQPRTENPDIRLDEPLAMAMGVPAQIRYGGQSCRGPTSLNRRSDL